jgi:hypothetical protein
MRLFDQLDVVCSAGDPSARRRRGALVRAVEGEVACGLLVHGGLRRAHCSGLRALASATLKLRSVV